jgi:hypothetical protein
MGAKAYGEFSVYWWDRAGNQHEEHCGVDAKTAVTAAKRLAHGPASVLGIVSRVIITDGVNCINFEWKKGEGVTFGLE